MSAKKFPKTQPHRWQAHLIATNTHKLKRLILPNSSRENMNYYSLLLSLATLFLSLAQGLLTPNCDVSDDDGSTLQIMHADHPCSPYKSKSPHTMLQMHSNDKIRHQFLSNLAVPLASGTSLVQRPIYIVRARIGTPEKALLMAMDTSNDAAWIPCQGCIGCTSTANFNPTASSTFNAVHCGAPQCNQVPNPRCGGPIACAFNMSYGGATFAATLVQDTLALGTDMIPGYFFGCVLSASGDGNSLPPQGLLGLGRGPLSLLSQTPNLYQSIFSYCLPNFRSLNFSGSLRLGARNQPNNFKCTQLIKNPRRSSLYYVNLMAIRVGSRLLDIPSTAFAFDPNTGAGTIIDSGTTFTSLVWPAYRAVRDEVRRQMGSAAVTSVGGFDTCYTAAVVVTSITLMFDGMSMTLPQENFLIRSGSGATCLAMAASPGNVNSVLNIIAAFQQQNHRIVVDRPNSSICVARESCT